MTIVKSLSEGTKDNGKKQGTSLSKAVLDLKNAVLTGACVFVISDFYDYDEDLFKHLGQLATKADVACIHVYDVLEEKAPPAGMYRISDGKEVSTINSSDEKWCEAFEDYFKKQKEEIEKFCHQRRISYLNIRTDEKDLPKALRYKLHTQKRRSIGVSSMRKEA
jgi:hypothetical protein